ncbi:exodeoxyribonuclease VII large subunit, partial [Staphylococcus haemolyticus]
KLEFKNKVELLNNLSPTNTMLRGYSIINKDDKVITSTQDLSKDDEITLAMKDGNVDAIVKKVRCEHE